MKAFILAAGLGTRLKPWTLSHPKALVPVGGIPMLRRVIESIRQQGFDSIVVNTHHFSNQIIDYLHENNFGIDIVISDESARLMDTGGGIVKAEELLASGGSHFLIHNVDILTDVDLKDFINKAGKSNADVFLLVSRRNSTRKLIFDSEMRLKGWHNLKTNEYIPSDYIFQEGDEEFAFSGIYAMNDVSVSEMKALFGNAPFPIMNYFLNTDRICKVKGMSVNDINIIDIGKPETLEKANRIFS